MACEVMTCVKGSDTDRHSIRAHSSRLVLYEIEFSFSTDVCLITKVSFFVWRTDEIIFRAFSV